MNFPEKEMEAMLLESLQNDDQLLVHAVGDRTTEAFLNAMEATGGKKVWGSRRVRIDHGDGIVPDLMARVKELGVVVVQNPTHLGLAELSLKRFGRERAEQLQPLRSLLKAGVPLALVSRLRTRRGGLKSAPRRSPRTLGPERAVFGWREGAARSGH